MRDDGARGVRLVAPPPFATAGPPQARSVDDDRTGALPAELDVSSLRLSHGLMRLEEEQSKLEVVVKARRADFVAARDVMRDASARLGEKLPAEFDEVGHEDLTLARLGTFRQTLEQLQAVEAERAVELARLRASSLALVKELDDEALDCYDDDFGEDDDYVRSDGSVLPKALNSLGAAKVEKAKRRLTALKDEKQSRLARLSSLGEEISLLWERLDVGEAKQLSFRAAVKHSSISKATFKIGEKELAALRTELHTRLGDLVAARRARIKALWDEMTEPDAARRDFGAYFDASEPTEEMLAAHEAKLAQLEARREALQPLLKMIEKREELLLERTALNALQKDASRLLRRGPGAAQERKYEVDAMKRVKGLPKLTEKLFEKLVEWERTQSPVLRDGLRYLDKMRDDQKEAAAERAQALEAKKLAATIRKEKLRDRNLQ